MSDQLKMSDQMSLLDSHSAISLPALESGAMPCDSLDGPTTDQSGLEVAPVKVSQQQGKVKGLRMLATSGLLGIDSSASAALQRSLESRLRQQLDSAGSTLFKLTWKRKRTPLGRSYLARAVSGHRTSDSAFTSLPTPNTLDSIPREGLRPSRIATNRESGYLSEIVPLASVVSPQEGDAHRGGQAKRYLEKNHAVRLNDQAMLSAVPTPIASKNTPSQRDDFTPNLANVATLASVPTQMAGTPTQKGYNEAGSTDYERKMDVALGLRETVNSPKLTTVSTPTAQDHSRGGKPARPQDTGVPLSQQAALATVASPSARDWKDTSGMSETGVDPDGSIRSRLDQLPRQAQLAASGQTATGGTGATESTGQLAPDYSRWLMGLPPEWCDCVVTAMASFRKSPRRSSKRT